MGHYAKLRRKLSASPRKPEESAATNQQQDSFDVTKKLVEAVEGKRPAKVERILQGDDDDSTEINLNDPRLKRCLLDAVKSPGYLLNQEIAILLIQHGVRIDKRCLDYAAENGNEDISEHLSALFEPDTLAARCRNVIRKQILTARQQKSPYGQNLAALVNRLDSIPLYLKQYLMLKRL